MTEEADETSIESHGGGPRRLLIAGGAAAVVFAALVVATRGDDGSGGGCVSGLAGRLPTDVEVVSGSDYGRAEDAGLDIDSLDGLVDASVEASFLPDPLTGQVVLQLADDDPEATTGYGPEDIDCWIGDQTGAFVAEGDFDADRVEDAGVADDLALDGDLLAYNRDGGPEAWFDESDDTPISAAVGKLDDLGTVTFSGFPINGEGDEHRWVGLGLAHDDDWELVAVWAFADADAAESSTGTIVDAVEQGEVPSMIEGDVADQIERDGALLTLRAPMRVEPSEWRTPLVQLDSMFGVVLDFDDDDGDDDSGDDDSGGEESPEDGG